MRNRGKTLAIEGGVETPPGQSIRIRKDGKIDIRSLWEHRPPRPKKPQEVVMDNAPVWLMICYCIMHKVRANTRSEARAMFKKFLGLKRRLPQAASIIRSA